MDFPKSFFARGARQFALAQCRRQRTRLRAPSRFAGNALPSRPRWKRSSMRRCSGNLIPSRQALLTSAHVFLPPYLVFVAKVSVSVCRSNRPARADALPPRRKEDRAHERHLLLYLQRVCAKNDSLSEFGPEGWGAIEGEPRGLKLAPAARDRRARNFSRALDRARSRGRAECRSGDPA